MTTCFRFSAAVISLACLLCAGPADAQPGWLLLQTPNFTIVGDAGERPLRDVGVRLEEFREVLSRMLSKTIVKSGPPTIVVVFSSVKAHQPFLPKDAGQGVDADGWYSEGVDSNYIVLNAERAADAYPSIFHRYTHQVVDGTLPFVPAWLDEGFAEYYSTFESAGDGRRASIGDPPAYNVALLRQQPLLPLQDVLSVTRESPLYNEGSRRSIFYAQSWALVHYLLLGNPDRWPQLLAFLTAVSEGRPSDRAFVDAFGVEPPVIASELQAYVKRGSYKSSTWTFGTRLDTPKTAQLKDLPQDDVEGYLADLLIRLGRPQEARQRLEPLARSAQSPGRAAVVLAKLNVAEGRFDVAIPLVERVIANHPDDYLAHYYLGVARRHILEKDGSRATADPKAWDAVRVPFARAVDLQQEFADALANLGLVESHDSANLLSARDRLTAAVRLAPTHVEYRLMLGEVLIRLEEFTSARQLLSPMVAGATGDAIKPQAQAMLQRVDQGEAARQAQRAASRADARTPDAARAETRSDREPELDESALIVLRPLKAGEERAEANLLAIDCAPGGRNVARFTRADNETPFALQVPDLGRVEFITYRDNVGGAVNCGPRERSEFVLVTWMPPAAAGTIGRLVAVEFVPRNYRPQ